MLDIKGEIITTDAIGCQKDIAEKIQKQGGNYLFAVKGHKERINKAFEWKLPLKIQVKAAFHANNFQIFINK